VKLNLSVESKKRLRKGFQLFALSLNFFCTRTPNSGWKCADFVKAPTFCFVIKFFSIRTPNSGWKCVQGQVRVCRESAALLPSSKMMSVPHPLPPPHVSLTPPYVQLTGWIRELLAANQLTLAQIKALRKPLRVVSAATRGGAPTRVHRVECIIYPVTNYSPTEEEEEKGKRPKVAVSGRLVRQGQGSELVLFSVWGERKTEGCIFL
jgi:hypothetical protein